MSLSTILAAVEFWTGAAGWGTYPGMVATREYTSGEKSQIIDAIIDLYQSSPQITAYLEAAASVGPIRFAEGGAAGGYTNAQGPYFLISPASSADNVFMNDKGAIVHDDLRLAIAHEIGHATGMSDPPSNPSIAALDSANFDYRTAILDFQNQTAADLGLTDHIQASYFFDVDVGTVASRHLALDRATPAARRSTLRA